MGRWEEEPWVLAQQLDRAEEAALSAGISHVEFWAMTPAELAARIRAARRRRNQELSVRAYELSRTISLHVARSKQHLVTPRALLLGMPGFAPDPEDL